MGRTNIKLTGWLILLFIIHFNSKLQAQCSPIVPSFTIDLTGDPAGVWTSPNVSRTGTCCSAGKQDECIYFYLTLDSAAAGIQIDMKGANPYGSLFYDIGCAGNYPGGTVKCITGVGPLPITICKPGNNPNIYIISSISKPRIPPGDTVRIGCKHKLGTLGLRNDSTYWTSVYPGPRGTYDSYLDSLDVANPTYSPALNAPAYVDYEVTAFPIASACGYSLVITDTIRIYNMPVLNGTVIPDPASFCSGSGVTLSVSASGGLSPYSFKWSNTSGTLSAGSSYYTNVAGSYNVEIFDQLYEPANCPSIVKPVSVIEGTIPIVDAGPSQKVCGSSPTAVLSASIQFATGGIWSGGTGTFTPGNNYLITSYDPSSAELAAGFTKLYFTSAGAGGGCQNQKDSTYIYYSSPLLVNIVSAPLLCYNSTVALNTSVSGGTHPYTYLWSTGVTISSVSANQGLYSVQVSDSLGCNAQANINLSAPPPLIISFTTNNATVNGGNDGSTTASILGGTPSYSILWSIATQTTMALSNLSYGVYTATVTDTNGCNISAATVVNEPRCLAFTAMASGTNVTCNGSVNGVASVTVSGGTPGYNYSWNTNPVQTSSVANGLQAGVYSVLISDANLCYQTANISINQPLTLTDVITGTNVSTIGGNDGSAAVYVYGGVTPYSYLWSTSSTATTISNLTAGTYSVNITDEQGCNRTDSVKIAQPPCNYLTLNILSNNVPCYGGNNGSALAVVGGAIGSYTVSWSNNEFGPSASGLGAGSYSVMVTDSKNCTQFKNFSITQPSPLSIGLLPTGVRCYGYGDGSIDLSISGGTFPYSISWSNGATSEDLAYLNPGSYSVSILDASGCTAVGSAVISQPAALTTTYVAQNVLCHNGNNGSIDLSVNGGVFPYTYTWSTGAGSQDVTNLSASGYTVLIKDANNCVRGPLIIGISEPDSVAVDSFIVSCPVPGSGQTQVTVNPIGGFSGVFQVSFNNGVSFQSPGNYSVFLANGGTYSVIVKDGNNCFTPHAATLHVLNETRIDSVVYAKCYAPGASITTGSVYPSGGALGIYSINAGAGFQSPGTYTFNLNTAATYSFVASDSRGCQSATVTSVIPAPLTSTAAVASNYNGYAISCFGLSDGSASVFANGGTGAYSYSWATIPAQTNTIAVNLNAGTYSVIVKDINSCTLSATVLLTEPAILSATTSVGTAYNGQNVSCYGSADGSATVIATGGTGAYTYSWTTNPVQTGSVAVSLTAGNFSVIIKDINNCSVIKAVSLTQSPALTTTVLAGTAYNGQNVSCYGSSDGSATLTALGGTGAYTYTWSTLPVQTNSVATFLGAGIYNVSVADANGCTSTKSVNLTQPVLLTATAAVASNYNGRNISCYGLSDGSASVTAVGGTGAYTYSWSNTQTSFSVGSLSAGVYSVFVRDVNNCLAVSGVALTDPPLLTSTAAVVSNYNGYAVSCYGLSNGSASVSANGGTGVYSFSWTTTPGQITNLATSMSAGNYTVFVRDINNCASNSTLSLNQPVSLTSTAIVTSNYGSYNISCFGLKDGSASVYVSGGTGSYTYTWSTNPIQTATNAVSLGAGIYNVTVSDNNSCVSVSTVTLTQASQFTATVNVAANYHGQAISCYGMNDGSASVTASGGTGSYSYSWTTSPVQTTSLATLLSAGNYTVFASDGNGCLVTRSFTVNQPAPLTATAGVSSNYNGQHISCFGLVNGSASVLANGGTGPYSYLWSTMPPQTSPGANSLGAGVYSVIVTDANACSSIQTLTLTQPSPLTSTVSIISNYNGYAVSCFGLSNGSASVTASGGTGSYTYLWNTVPSQTLNQVSALSAGNYVVFVYDANLCSTGNTLTLNQPSLLSSTAIATSNYNGLNISCYGLNDGSAQVTSSGGAGAYSYTWTTVPAQFSFSVTGLYAGNYSVTTEDANGCLSSSAVSLTQPAQLTLSLVNVSDYHGYGVSCHNSTNGFVDIFASGGTGTYTYLWSNNASSQDLNNIPAGIYSVNVSDVNGCINSLSVGLTEPAELNATIDSLADYHGYQVSCYGLSDGAAYVSISGGVQTYSYFWSNGATTEDLNGISSGTYTLSVSDLNQCTAVISAILNQPPAIGLTYTVTEPVCMGISNGSVAVALQGGVGSFTYHWSNNSSQKDLLNISAGTYSVMCTDENGCSKTQTMIVSEPQLMTIQKDVTNIKCYGEMGGIKTTVNGGVTPYSYLWSNEATGSSVENLAGGSYVVIITDAGGCKLKDTTVLNEPAELTTSLYSPVNQSGNNISTYHGNDGVIDLTVNGGTAPYNYIWSNSNTSQDMQNLTAGSYYVTVIDANGCRANGNIMLTEPLVLEMPTGYSPNGDGKNDYFVIHGIEAYPDNALTVFNRWGNIVYSKKGYQNEWNGNSNNGLVMPSATYFVLLEINGGEIVLKGYVDLRK